MDGQTPMMRNLIFLQMPLAFNRRLLPTVTAYLILKTLSAANGATVQIECAPPEGVPFRLQIRTATENANGVISQQNATADIGNLYTAQFELLQKGTYRIQAIGKSGNLTLGEDQIDVYAHPQLAELEAPQLNETLLKQLVEQTGGAYFAMAEARSLPENVANVQTRIVDAGTRTWAHP